MNLKANTTMAWIYGLFFLVSAVIAFGLFKFLPSSAVAEGELSAVKINLGGAIGGFFGIFWALHVAYSKMVGSPAM